MNSAEVLSSDKRMGCSMSELQTLDEAIFISTSLRNNELLLPLMNILSPIDMSFFIDSKKIVTLLEGEQLEEPDDSDSLYLVMDGRLGYKYEGKDMYIERGYVVYETAFLYHIPEDSMIFAVHSSKLYKFTRKSYDDIILEPRKYLKSLPMFAQFNDDERNYLYDYVKVVQFVRGDMILSGGAPCDLFFVIIDGVVGYGKNELHPMHCFGNVSSTTKRHHDFDVISKTETTLLAIDATCFSRVSFQQRILTNGARESTLLTSTSDSSEGVEQLCSADRCEAR